MGLTAINAAPISPARSPASVFPAHQTAGTARIPKTSAGNLTIASDSEIRTTGHSIVE